MPQHENVLNRLDAAPPPVLPQVWYCCSGTWDIGATSSDLVQPGASPRGPRARAAWPLALDPELHGLAASGSMPLP